MRQRGRQSGAGLEIIPPASAGPNLQPPRHLIATEARLFHEVVANAPPGQFSASDVYLLATFAQVTLLVEGAARAAAKANDKTRQARFKMLDQAVKMQALLASKLRLATQSRIAPRTVCRAHDGHRPSAYDTMGFDREFFEDDWRR